ncbi:hypothetical protein TNCV_4623151 [Trichonephila clavipes]|nr:hypothetical protein TNCV_4623151 [Trichonephila clavipes]
MGASVEEKAFVFLNLANCHRSHLFAIGFMPQLQEDIDNFILQLELVPPHWSANVRDYFEENLPHRSIGRAAVYNLPLIKWLCRLYTVRLIPVGVRKGQSLVFGHHPSILKCRKNPTAHDPDVTQGKKDRPLSSRDPREDGERRLFRKLHQERMQSPP